MIHRQYVSAVRPSGLVLIARPACGVACSAAFWILAACKPCLAHLSFGCQHCNSFVACLCTKRGAIGLQAQDLTMSV